MKYTVCGFQQSKLLEFGLNGTDVYILRWFIDFYLSDKMAKVYYKNQMYVWVKYKSIIEDIPILGITNEEVIGRHFKKFVACGLMERYIKKSGGTFICFKLNEEKYSVLIGKYIKNETVEEPMNDLKVESDRLKGRPDQDLIDSKVVTKDYSINYNYSINNKEKVASATIDKSKNLHTKIKLCFEDLSSKISKFKEPYYHDAKEAKCISNILKRGNQNEKYIFKKMELFYNLITKSEQQYWSSQTFCPSAFICNWNRLDDRKAEFKNDKFKTDQEIIDTKYKKE